MDILIVGIICYLIGSIPFGYILTKVFLKKDIRDIGSGNIGATNALRTGNKTVGYATLFFDIVKAVIPIIYIKFNFTELLYIASLCIFLGHVFPIWLKFKGGKGVATYVGILFALNIYFGLVFIVSWFITFALFKFSSLSSLVASISIPIYLLILSKFEHIFFFTIMFVLVFFTHRENILKLKRSTENKIKL